MIRGFRSVAALVLLALTSGVCPAAETPSSFLKPHEKIMWVGDSITAQNLYEPYVMNVLRVLYPDGDFSMVNAGVGGAMAPTRFGGIPRLVEAEHPTLMTVMFGVNDTGWSVGNDQQKIENYAKGLTEYVELTRQKNLDLLFIHETHFSHNINAQPLEIGLDSLLMKLFSAEDQLAAANHLGVIDAYGAYVRELGKAWQADPKYEFTPNFVHPTMLGHAAVAGEILRTFGAGLPLRSGERPALVTAQRSFELSAKTRSDVLPVGEKLPIVLTAHSLVDRAARGDLVAVVAGQRFSHPVSIDAGGHAEFTIELPASAMSKRWEVQPIYIAFVGPDAFDAAEIPLYYAHLIPSPSSRPFAHDDKGWVRWEGVDPAETTASDIKASVTPQSLRVEFTWKDQTPVTARMEPYKSRLGDPVTTPLDATSPFGQPCDAVELLLDLRGKQSAARYTSNMDSIPEGTARVGLYRVEENGKSVCRLQVTPATMEQSFKLFELGGDRFAIEWTGMVPACGIGLDMLVTDAKEYAPNKTLAAYMTSVPRVGSDWVDFYRLSPSSGTFVRVGY